MKTLYQSKKLFGSTIFLSKLSIVGNLNMEISEAKCLKQLEDENRRLKQIVADLMLDNQALKLVVQKNEISLPAKKR